MRRTLATMALFALGCSDPAGGPDAGRSDTLDASANDAGANDAGAVGDATRDGAAALDGLVPLDAPEPADAPRCARRASLGLFVWGDDLAARRDAILDLAASAGVTEVYLHANLFYAGDLDETVLADWIRAANARCIDVELLFGNARWILPPMQREARDRTDWAVGFASAHPDARPTGVHFDLEPQQLGEWDVTADRPTLLASLVDVLEAMTPAAEAGGLVLSIDVGFFLDGYDVTRAGRTRPASEWITDAVGRVVVMDYRDSAESMGFGGMISLAEDEVAYATTTGTPIVLAAETGDVAPEYVTFREEGLAAMRTELAAVRAHFATSASFAGLAIHDERALRDLPP